MLPRILVAFPLAVLITLALLLGMQGMLDSGARAITDERILRPVDFVDVERAKPSLIPTPRPERPPKPAIRPGSVRPAHASEASVKLRARIDAPQFSLGARASAGLAMFGDSEYQPMVTVAPIYPEQAVARNLEGFVIIEYTVTTAGTVRDVTVVDSTAPLLEAAAVKAALKFQFRPRIVGGVPVEVTGVMQKIVFVLEQPQQFAAQL